MHDHRHKKLVLVGTSVFVLAAAFVAGGVWKARHRGNTPVAGRTSLGPFHVGEEIHNRASMTMTLEMGEGAPPQEVVLDGQWTATVTDIHDGLAQVACQLSQLTASVRQDARSSSSAPPSDDQRAAERQLAADLMRRFFVSYRMDGSAAAVWLPKGMNPTMSSMLLRLAGASQLVRPAGTAAAWVVQERDINGEYTAVYQQTAPDRFTKQKGRYMRPSKQDLPIEVERSKYDLRADARGRVLEVDQDEALAIDVSGTKLSFKVMLHVALGDAKTRRVTELVGAFGRERDGLERHLMEQLGVDAKAETARHDRSLLAGASLEQLVAALRALPAQTETASASDQAKALGTRFEALFRLEAEAAGRAPGLVRSETADRARILIDALTLAGTPQAQAALGAIAKEAATALQLRRQATQYLGMQKQPAEPAVGALRELLDDPNAEIRQTAALAYGTTARAIGPGAPERARPIVAELHRRFAGEKNDAVRADLIAAIGNAGHASSLSTLRPVIDQGTSALRGRAIRALRFIADPAVDPLLTSLLQDKTSEQVRLAAIGAIRHRDVGPFTMSLADVAQADPVEAVRQAAIDLLGNRMRELPALRTVLERARKQDPNPRIRELAAGHLGVRPTGG